MEWQEFQACFPDQDYSDVFDDRTVTELLETGSVTVQVKHRKFIVALRVIEDD